LKRHLNTLFVQTQGAYLRKDGEAVAVRIEDQTALRVPLHQLDGIVTFGQVSASPFLLGACGEAGVSFSMLTRNGRFLAAVQGFTPGNVLLRREQYRRADDPEASLALARPMVAAKIANLRTVLLRAARDHPPTPAGEGFKDTASNESPQWGTEAEHPPGRSSPTAESARRMRRDAESAMTAASLDELRGIEGESAATYFRSFDAMLTAQQQAFAFGQRSRRPPMNPCNALLSFLYTLLAHDYRSACESIGLDAQSGFLHRNRPGRPSLALDLMEALRPVLADRLALSLINRQQVKPAGFTTTEAGGVTMTPATRKTVLAAWQKRKQDELHHPFLGEKIQLGLLPHLQARLLARTLRGDHDFYPEFIWR
jgi:CRISPR-associated protein Cas1